MHYRQFIARISIIIGAHARIIFVQAKSHRFDTFPKTFVQLPLTNTSSIISRSLTLSRTSIVHQRGGGFSNEYDDYDDYGYDYDPLPRSRKPPRGSPPPRGHQPPYPPHHPRKQQKPSALDRTSDLAKQTLNIATSTTLKTIKGTGKAAYYLTAPKHVTRDEIYGLWRLDQVLLDGDPCSANVQLTIKGDVITQYNQEKEERTMYHFRSRSWPMSCTIEFEARAFQGSGDVRPVTYYYKGVFRRKLADKSVIKIVGKIYEVKRGRFSRGSSAGLEVGSFVGRRRIISNDRVQYNRRNEEDMYDIEQSDRDEDYYDTSEGYDYSSYGEEESGNEEV